MGINNLIIGTIILGITFGYLTLLTRIIYIRENWEVAFCLFLLFILVFQLYIQVGKLKTFTIRMLVDIKMSAEKGLKNLEDIQHEKETGEKSKIDEVIRH